MQPRLYQTLPPPGSPIPGYNETRPPTKEPTIATALITGVTGQDGSCLAEALLAKGYIVHGTTRDRSGGVARLARYGFPTERIALHETDLLDPAAIARLLGDVRPTRLFHLAGESRVAASFADPAGAMTTHPVTAARLIRGIVDARLANDCRLFLASSSEIFDPGAPGPWDETTPLGPVSPYGAAKAATHLLAKVAREGYGLFAVSGVLFNHESPRRDDGFVGAKIVQAARRLAKGDGQPLLLGNLDAARDWGWAPQFVEGMIASLDAEGLGDYVFATGETHTIRQFATAAFAVAGRVVRWEGKGLDETGLCAATGKTVVVVDPALFRPIDKPTRPGDPFRAAQRLGWRPTVRFDELVARLVREERP